MDKSDDYFMKMLFKYIFHNPYEEDFTEKSI